jgi:prepilin-type N-terminal cleavage/methylation domain-containing protein
MTLPSRAKGFTIIEILIALAIFGILIAIASGAIVQYLRVQSDQEAVTSAQAKLRRVTELVSQEMRGAVFGSIIADDADNNYDSDKDSISFLLLDGGAGYPVLPHDSGNNASFPSAANLQISSSSADTTTLGIDDGNELLMVNAKGEALLFTATNVSKNGGAEWRITHSGGCKNTIEYTPNTLLFKVRTFAVRHDLTSKTLFARENGLEQTLAWNISEFKIDYVYEQGSVTKIDEPGYPAKDLPNGFSLKRLQFVASTKELSRGKEIERTYSSQIEIADNNQIAIGGLTVCR